MKLLSEVIINIKKGMFPQLVFDIYKSGCEVQNLEFIEYVNSDEHFKFEIMYNKRNNFLQLIEIIDSFPERYKIESVANAIEEKIKGGLLNFSGKLPLENMVDYEIGLLGAVDLIHAKINKGEGLKYSGLSRNVGLLGCIKYDEEVFSQRLLKVYANAERDAVILNKLTGLNPIPLIIRFNHSEDLNKSIQMLEGSFSSIRFIDIDETDILTYEQICSDISVPVSSYFYDDIPLYLLTLIKKIKSKKKLKANETTIGLIGINLTAIRSSRVLIEDGFYRVLGYDHNEKQMLTFEKNGGLATTVDNIFSNADIVVFLKECYNEESFQKIRPGLNIVSFLEDDNINMKLITSRGVREFVRVEKSNILVISPGLIKGIIESENNSLGDNKLIDVSSKLVKLMSEDYLLPDIFSNIHEKISEYII